MKLTISLSIVFLLVIFSIACEKKNALEVDNLALPTITQSLSASIKEAQWQDTTYKIYCKGPSNCSLVAITSEHVACIGSDCVTVLKKEDNNTIFELVDAELEIPLLNDFNNYILKQHPTRAELAISLIEVQVRNGTTAVGFTYSIEGVTDKIIIVEEEMGKKYAVSCDGNSACTLEFKFTLSAAFCDGDDCVMSVYELDE